MTKVLCGWMNCRYNSLKYNETKPTTRGIECTHLGICNQKEITLKAYELTEGDDSGLEYLECGKFKGVGFLMR